MTTTSRAGGLSAWITTRGGNGGSTSNDLKGARRPHDSHHRYRSVTVSQRRVSDGCVYDATDRRSSKPPSIYVSWRMDKLMTRRVA
jgi:hypothetical protein